MCHTHHWLEYLSLVFFFKMSSWSYWSNSFIELFSFGMRQRHQVCSGLNIKINKNHTSTIWDFCCNRIANVWNNIPNDVRQAESVDSFKRKLKSFYFKRLFRIFYGDNFLTFKTNCPKWHQDEYPFLSTC